MQPTTNDQKPSTKPDELSEKNSSEDSAELQAQRRPLTPPSTIQTAVDMLKRPKGAAMIPMPGFEWNPLRTLPRNNLCPCRSGKKFKACCLAKLPPVVSEKAAKIYREQMAKPQLIFITKENEAALQQLAPEGLGKPDGHDDGSSA